MSLILLLFFIIYKGKKSTLEIPVASLNTPVVRSLFSVQCVGSFVNMLRCIVLITTVLSTLSVHNKRYISIINIRLVWSLLNYTLRLM